jgi:hypothetical protein
VQRVEVSVHAELATEGELSTGSPIVEVGVEDHLVVM